MTKKLLFSLLFMSAVSLNAGGCFVSSEQECRKRSKQVYKDCMTGHALQSVFVKGRDMDSLEQTRAKATCAYEQLKAFQACMKTFSGGVATS